jgi:hypothetical protein
LLGLLLFRLRLVRLDVIANPELVLRLFALLVTLGN